MSEEARLKEIFEDIFNPEDGVDPSKVRGDYPNWDSLANVTLFMAVNDEFGNVMTLEDMENLDSFEKMLTYIRDKLA